MAWVLRLCRNMKFITLSTDPTSYGSEFEGDIKALNNRIRAAAEANEIDVVEGNDTHPIGEQRQADGDIEIDWFAQWCADGHRWTAQQWKHWFASHVTALESA